MEQKNSSNLKKPRRLVKTLNKENYDEYRKVMQSETQDGMSVYDYYYLDQNDIQ